MPGGPCREALVVPPLPGGPCHRKAKIKEALVGGQPWRGNGSRVLHREAKIRKALLGGFQREGLGGRPLPVDPCREALTGRLAGRPLPLAARRFFLQGPRKEALTGKGRGGAAPGLYILAGEALVGVA